MNWYLDVLRNYAKFDGRARRTEYWMFTLFNLIVMVVLGIILGLIDPVLVGLVGLYSLGVMIPALAVSVRRLHDTNRSGWWILVSFVPLIGGIILLVLMCLDGTSGDNEFGPDPKQGPNGSF